MEDHEIVTARLVRQRVWGTPLDHPADVVGWLAAVQAQDFSGSKWGLAQRLREAREDSLDRAFAAGEILRTHLLRPTWHFVTPADIRPLLALTGPRVHARTAGQYRITGIDPTMVDRSHRVLQRELAGRPLSRPALRDALDRDGIDTAVPTRLSHLLMHAELDGLICSGPRIGNQFSYRLLDELVPAGGPLDIDTIAADLALRFVRSRAPVTVYDMATWSGLTVTACRAALEANRPELTAHDGYWTPVEAAVQPRAEPPRALLLSVYDEYISGYRDRSAAADPAFAARLVGLGNDLTGVIFLDGRTAGTWKRDQTATELSVRLNLFRPVTATEEAELAAAKRRLAEFAGVPLAG